MACKRINFDLSLRYYLKDYDSYFRCDCHINTFQKFFDNNYEEIEANEHSFKYVIGLYLFNYDGKKLCYLHSWIEKNNEVIDVTPFANAFVSKETVFEGPEFEESKRVLTEARYISIKSMSNKKLNNDLKAFMFSKHYSTPEKAMEDLLKQWILDAESSNIIKKQISDFGYEFTNNFNPLKD